MAKKELDRFATTYKKNMQIQTKLLGFIMGAAIISCIVTFFIVITVFTNKQLDNEKERIEVNSTGLYRLIEDWRLQLTQYTYLFSVNDSFSDALYNQGEDFGALEDIVDEITSNLDLDFYAVTDRFGNILVADELSGNIKTSRSVKAALQGSQCWTYEGIGNQEFSIVSAAPVFHDGQIAGTIVLGYAFDNQLLCDEAVEGYDLECTIFKSNFRVDTTLQDANGNRLVGTYLENQDVIDTVLGNSEKYVGTVEINGTQYVSCYTPLISEDYTVPGMLFVAKSLESLEASRNSTIPIVAPICIIMIAVMLAITGFFVRWLMWRIKNVTTSLEEMATGEADLTKRCKLFIRDEIGFLVIQFDAFCDKLQQIISEIKSSKNELTETGNSLSSSIEDATSAITEISGGIDSIHTQIRNSGESVKHTADAVNEISQNISTLDNLIDSQSQKVSEAASAIEQMIGNISSVNSSVEKMAGSFESLSQNANNGFSKQQDVNEKIKEIEAQSEMLQEANLAISSIAEQTNLLAMNAAIEAAHAGEAGKGFSVVADEIRKLSETSSSQSKTIGEQLNKIREQISQVVTASFETSEAFTQVSQKISETDQLVVSIKAAMEEQTAGSQQISGALHSMNDSTQDVNRASKNMAQKNELIQDEVQNLQKLTRQMEDSMEEMAVSSNKVSHSGQDLGSMSEQVKSSIQKIGSQIDLFKV